MQYFISVRIIQIRSEFLVISSITYYHDILTM
jgi:hypothetical protein